MQITTVSDSALTQLGVEFHYQHNHPHHGGVIDNAGPFEGMNLRPAINTHPNSEWYCDIPDGKDEELSKKFGRHFYRRNDGHPIITSFF